MVRPTTGLRPLDDLIGGLRVGDNVVWETGEDATVDPFAAALVRASRETPGFAYVSFHVSPTEVLDRFQQVWDPKRFLLVDCFTDGIGRGEETFGQFYRSRRERQVRIRRITEPLDAEAAQEALSGIEEELGQGARYVFDSVTGMQGLWGAEAALSFFQRSCPRLYELKTVAYWLLERQAHSASFLSRLSHVTQVVLDVRAGDEGQTLKVLKAEGRPPDVLGRHAGYVFEGDRIRILREGSGTRERMGEVLRAQRIARGLSQTEFAQRIGISASALSQVERGRTGFSGETLTRAWEALGLGFGSQASRTAVGWQVTRRGARQERSLAPGLVAEEASSVSDGAGVHLLTLEPGANGRRPPFATKHVEVAYVMAGLLELRVGEAKETLHAGDTITLSGEPIAAWRNPGPEEARVLWIILPSDVRPPPPN